jgi:hypothetical protein
MKNKPKPSGRHPNLLLSAYGDSTRYLCTNKANFALLSKRPERRQASDEHEVSHRSLEGGASARATCQGLSRATWSAHGSPQSARATQRPASARRS